MCWMFLYYFYERHFSKNQFLVKLHIFQIKRSLTVRNNFNLGYHLLNSKLKGFSQIFFLFPLKSYEKRSFTVYENNCFIESYSTLNIPILHTPVSCVAYFFRSPRPYMDLNRPLTCMETP